MYDLDVFSENLAMSNKPLDQVREESPSHSAEWESIRHPIAPWKWKRFVDIPHLKGQRPLLRKETMYRTMVLLYECLEEFLGSREDSSRIGAESD